MPVVLSPYTDCCGAEIAAWPSDSVEAKTWAGDRTWFPVPQDQFHRWHADPDVDPYVAHQNDKLVAYGELWIDRVEQEVELARNYREP